ncbi:hypothetical protein PTQ35_01000 [Campylobacter sp. 46490-21]|uniref:hypothetical protein n=1 Tax=Campylobacter magnus TaxID=3026462 RepID=UPI00235FC88F|nr:hypothetical protein [Campylobacter magnus]MDD0847392.1 hypothetical protein [Campylobacter magnus]
MTTITLDNKIGADVIEAIKALLAGKPKELYSIRDAEGISEADKAELIETYELVKAGKMEWMSEDEVRESLAKRGYEW